MSNIDKEDLAAPGSSPVPQVGRGDSAPQAEHRWQPIETAPKDGTLVLLYCSEDVDRLYSSPEAAARYCIGYHGDSGGIYANEGWWSVESREEVWGYGSEYTGPMSETENLRCAPSHWMPLPPPPEGAG